MGNITAISSTESTLSDSEFDSCDLHDVKFIPNVSTFVLESQENVHKSYLKKTSRTKCELKAGPSGEDHVTCAIVRRVADTSTRHHKGKLKQDCFPQNYEGYFRSREDVPAAFNTRCLLPEFPELRDSYDQFCTMSEHSSRDDLDGKLSNRGSGMSVQSELKSARGMRDSRYSSDEILESVHACKRRKKTEQASDAGEKNHRWSMPEFTKLWHENCDNDPDYYQNGLSDSDIQGKDRQSYSEQSTQTCSTPVLTNTNSSESLLEYPTADISAVEGQKSASKEKITIGQSKSCQTLGSVEPSTYFEPRDYDSSGFYEDSGDDSLTSSPMHSRTSINTVKENPLGYKPDLKDSGIYAYEDVDSCRASVDDISVDARDSGYSEVRDVARDGPEGEETHFDEIEEIHVDRLSKSKHFGTTKKMQENVNFPGYCTNDEDFVNCKKDRICDLESHSRHNCSKQTHDDSCLEKGTALDGNKDKRCSQLMQEYAVNRTLDSFPPSSSFYRTSAV